jgi:lipopolysaccharide/colanic/teichoic acid biosynthesis glycosyltransferase
VIDLHTMYQYIKRFFDFLFAAILLLVISPILIPVMIGLKLTGEGYIWYFQERVGKNNKLFDIYKFATMLKDSPNMKGGIITTKKDPRLTPMGGFLRSTKINELPQVINVLRGEMSFVGPRPVLQRSFEAYPEAVKRVIYSSAPGITGIGSIIFRDEETLMTKIKERGDDPMEFYKNEIYPYKGEVELWYHQHKSFYTDFMILFITAWVILFPSSNLLYKVFRDLPKKPAALVLV